jgi:energy-converting hydrogenase Eha subunit A
MQTLIFKNEKKSSTYINSVKIVMLALALLTSFSIAKAQIYTSSFPAPIPAGSYSSVSPSGVGCLAPTLTNVEFIADANTANYASITGLLSAPLACTSPTYSIRAKLNFNGAVTAAPIGYQAGFRVSLNNVIALNVLQSNITLRTYLGGVQQQSITGANILGLSLLTPNTPTNIYFTAATTFDEVELVFNTSVISIGLALDYRIYNAFGAAPGTLPVTFNGLSAKIQGGNLMVDWNTESEKDNDKFIVQGSSDGKSWTDLGTVATKAPDGNSSVKISYSFSRQWGDTVLAGFGLLGLLLLPAVRNRLMRLGMLIVVVSMVVACAKDNDGMQNLEDGSRAGKATYIRIAQVDKDGTTTYTQPVVAKR